MEQLSYSPVAAQEQGEQPRIKRNVCTGLVVFMLIALCILITGITLLAIKGEIDCRNKRDSVVVTRDSYCEPSDEAKRIKLEEFLSRAKVIYFRLYPTDELSFHQGASIRVLKRVARKYRPYIPSHEFLKKFTDDVNELKKEIQEMSANKELMKPKENQSLLGIEAFLNSFMALMYDIDFYGGDWMLGPNVFCINIICHQEKSFKSVLTSTPLATKDDINFIIDTCHRYKKTWKQYAANMQLGVKSGMIRSKLACRSGIDALKEYYGKVIEDKDGGFSTIFPKRYTSSMPKNLARKWHRQHNETVETSLKRAWVEGFRAPLLKVIEYMEQNHIRHCPPDDEASGLSKLPLKYIYVDGVANVNNKTTQSIPITGDKLSGKDVYRKMVVRFTTLNISPEKVYEEGLRQLEDFYGQLVNASKLYTNKSDDTIAVQIIQKILNADDQWHGEKKFPKNESDVNAFKKCKNDEEAKKYCPVRWKSNQIWTRYMYRVLGMIHPKLNKVFYYSGKKVSTPACPVKMINHYNPSNGAMYFDYSDARCSRPGYFALPFFLEKYGPKFQEWSVNGHEARPGHHTQLQSMMELFQFPCNKGLGGFFHSRSYITSFIEGWALYGENPVLSDDVDLYKDNLLQKIGMIKWQVWRALRLVVDTGIHYRDMNRTWALGMFKKYTWDETDFVRKEITRYQSVPGQATAYMIGRLTILKARRKAERMLGDSFNIKDFHYQILSLGQASLEHVKDHIDRYINCVKEPSRKYCDYILSAPPKLFDNKQVLQRTSFPSARHYL